VPAERVVPTCTFAACYGWAAPHKKPEATKTATQYSDARYKRDLTRPDGGNSRRRKLRASCPPCNVDGN